LSGGQPLVTMGLSQTVRHFGPSDMIKVAENFQVVIFEAAGSDAPTFIIVLERKDAAVLGRFAAQSAGAVVFISIRMAQSIQCGRESAFRIVIVAGQDLLPSIRI